MEKIVKMLNENGIKAEVTKVSKNGVEKMGIMLGDGNIKPTIYPEGMTDGEILSLAKETLGSTFEFDPNSITDYVKAKPQLALRLVSKVDPDVMSRPAFADLYTIPVLNFKHQGSNCSVKVTSTLFKNWGITEDELFETAMGMTKKNYPAKCQSLVEMMKTMMGGIDMDLPSMPDQIVVSNEQKMFGAAAILYAEGLPEKFYMLPSSVHEVIIMAPDQVQDESELTSMVQEVNRTQVDPTEWLADHAYYYKDGEWSVVI